MTIEQPARAAEADDSRTEKRGIVGCTDWLGRIVCGDNTEVLSGFPAECVDLVVTSPPYDDLRTYGGHSWNFETLAAQLVRVLKPGGVIVWVVADATVNGSETLTSMRQALYFKDECGLNVHDTMIYRRETIPMNSNRYQPEWEYMLVLSKGTPKTVNLLREPSRLHLWGRPEYGRTNAQRAVNGETKKRSHRKLTSETKVRGNVWQYNARPNPSQDPKKWGHPATFPDLLASDHILTWTEPGDVVLDPCNGSGTTTQAAKRLGRQYVGIEINPAYCEIAKTRLAQEILPL